MSTTYSSILYSQFNNLYNWCLFVGLFLSLLSLLVITHAAFIILMFSAFWLWAVRFLWNLTYGDSFRPWLKVSSSRRKYIVILLPFWVLYWCGCILIRFLLEVFCLFVVNCRATLWLQIFGEIVFPHSSSTRINTCNFPCYSSWHGGVYFLFTFNIASVALWSPSCCWGVFWQI